MSYIDDYRECMEATARTLYDPPPVVIPSPPAKPSWFPPVRFQFVGPYLIPSNSAPTLARIKAAVARHYGIDDLGIASRRREVSHPRQLAIYLCKRLTTKSYMEIGKCFGMDHSTIIHAVRAVDRRRTDDSDLNDAIRTLSGKLSP